MNLHRPSAEGGNFAGLDLPVLRNPVRGGSVQEVGQAQVVPVLAETVVGAHQWGDLVSDACHFVRARTGLVQAGLSGGLPLGGELGVEERLKKIAPHVGPGPSGNPVVDAEAFQFDTPFSRDEDGLSRDGADLRWGGIRVGIPY
ncbi:MULTISPECIES: hypothetical protein [unclassified Streptomyces]|uniref:hypothetical protein n=1 Tax=unclassified Streptomyces TaxID=2593676 RepID=UPI0029BA5AD4|nr:hypothetical protein [Streptomyces sp. DK15]MDX2391089.1 hypothetical protein [Streptomyces sp. DK15]